MYKLHAIILIGYATVSSQLIGSDEDHRVSKRALLYPQFTLWQFTYGISAPAILPNRSINLSLGVQINYELPWNITHFYPTLYWGRKTAADNYYDWDRNTFYKYIIGVLDGFSLPGENCLLRTICEISEVPLQTERKNSVLEKILHYILTPSEDNKRRGNVSAHFESGESVFTNQLATAEMVGKSKRNCKEMYDSCKLSLVDLFTAKYKLF